MERLRYMFTLEKEPGFEALQVTSSRRRRILQF
jgi:hypothetical protein